MHIGEVTRLVGTELELVGAAVRAENAEGAAAQFACPIFTDWRELFESCDFDLLAATNEHDLKGEVILAALHSGKDVVADKPLCVSLEEQDQIEEALSAYPERRLLNLLTLRGAPLWAEMCNQVRAEAVGTPACTRVRMSVRLMRARRPAWFLDYRQSGGLFLDLLIHGLDYIEWITGRSAVALTAAWGNLGEPSDAYLVDHAAVLLEMEDGSTAVCSGQRMAPDTQGSDYRVTVAGTTGFADLDMVADRLTVTNAEGAGQVIERRPEPISIVADWLAGGELVPQSASLRANRLALLATLSAQEKRRIDL
jgi:predicted dehydrogenase